MQYATPPRFGTQPVEEGDDLFVLQRYTCADCGGTFETSRHSARCPMCQSLRQGQVGPATVTCRVCDVEHKVPVLAPHRLCQKCASDLAATEAHIRGALAAAEQAAEEAWERWEADKAHADPADQERYSRVCAAQDTPGFAERYARALTKGDGLSVLLRSAERAETALGAMQRTRAWSGAALDEVEAARDE